MTSCIGFLISMFGTRMCGQTLLFIVIANCAIPHLTLRSLLAAVGIGDVVYCGMGVVTWFTALTNQMHSALSVPHFTFRIPQFRILPTPLALHNAVGEKLPKLRQFGCCRL